MGGSEKGLSVCKFVSKEALISLSSLEIFTTYGDIDVRTNLKRRKNTRDYRGEHSLKFMTHIFLRTHGVCYSISALENFVGISF